MLRRFQSLWLAIGLVFCLTAHAVSRVGGGKVSNADMGFTAPLATDTANAYALDSGDIRLDEMGIYTSEGPPSSILSYFVLMLPSRFPEWQGKVDRQEFRQHFLRLGWAPLSQPEPCVEMFIKESNTAWTWVLSWGAGRGVVLVSPKHPVIVDRMASLADQLQLLPGACAWN